MAATCKLALVASLLNFEFKNEATRANLQESSIVVGGTSAFLVLDFALVILC